MVYSFDQGIKREGLNKFLLIATSITVAAVTVFGVATQQASAATTAVNCADLPSAIASATAGDTLVVSGECTLTGNTVVDKQLTIQGASDLVISTNGTNQILTVTADGTVLDGLNFVKTDKTGTQNIIGIQGDNVSILNSTFEGQYVLGDPEVSRALEVSSVTNFTLSGNSFDGLRQPAYINDFATGTISNNYVNGTRGFVVLANTDFEFTGNSWGTNAVDIAFIAPGTVPNNYSCDEVMQIRKDNNFAKVENQAQVPACATYPLQASECKDGKFATFTGQTFKNQGQCVAYVQSSSNSKHHKTN